MRPPWDHGSVLNRDFQVKFRRARSADSLLGFGNRWQLCTAGRRLRDLPSWRGFDSWKKAALTPHTCLRVRGCSHKRQQSQCPLSGEITDIAGLWPSVESVTGLGCRPRQMRCRTCSGGRRPKPFTVCDILPCWRAHAFVQQYPECACEPGVNPAARVPGSSSVGFDEPAAGGTIGIDASPSGISGSFARVALSLARAPRTSRGGPMRA